MRRNRFGHFMSEAQAEEEDRDAAEVQATDLRFATECYQKEVLPAVLDETYDGPELVVLSMGYAEVWSDGDVVSGGVVLFNVADLAHGF